MPPAFRGWTPAKARTALDLRQREAAGPDHFADADFRYTFVYPLATLPFMKDVGLRIRVQRDLRDAFLAACRAQDKPAAQVLREFMRDYVAKHPTQDAASQTRNEDAGLSRSRAVRE